MNTDGFLNLPWGKVWYRIANKDSNNTPLIVLHGGPGYPSDYLFSHELLADERPVVFYDQSGCGRSGRLSDQALMTVEHFVEELEALRKELKLDNIHLLGHSWGTMLAMDYLLTKPQGVKSVVFASPCISIPLWAKATSRYLDELPDGLGNIIRNYEREGNKQAPEYKAAVHKYHTTHECRIDPEPPNVKASNAHSGRDVYRHMWGPNEYTITGTLGNYDRGESLKEISIPALFTCGRYDGASPEAVAFYQSQIPGAEMKVFENSAHMPHLEDEEEYIQTVREFLAKHD